MKLLRLFSATAICLTAFSLNTRAQSTIRIGGGPEIKIDSLLESPEVDSLEFNKKPRYDDKNRPVTIPNAYKPQQAPNAPMPILKIHVCTPEPKKD